MDSFIRRISMAVKFDNEQFYHLENVQLKENHPGFVDIWILVRNVEDKE